MLQDISSKTNQNNNYHSKKKTSNANKNSNIITNSCSLQTIINGLKQQIQQCNAYTLRQAEAYKNQIADKDRQLNEKDQKIKEAMQTTLKISILQEQIRGCKKIEDKLQSQLRQKQLRNERLEEKDRQQVMRIQQLEGRIEKLVNRMELSEMEKNKHIEIGISEKLEMEKKVKVLEEEIMSKKRIVRNIKEQLENCMEKEKKLMKREKEIEMREYALNGVEENRGEESKRIEAKFKSSVKRLSKENQFLREHVSKMEREKRGFAESKYERENTKLKNKCFQLKRKLTKVKIQLGRDILKGQLKKKRDEVQENETSSESSLNLSVSEDTE